MSQQRLYPPIQYTHDVSESESVWRLFVTKHCFTLIDYTYLLLFFLLLALTVNLHARNVNLKVTYNYYEIQQYIGENPP